VKLASCCGVAAVFFVVIGAIHHARLCVMKKAETGALACVHRDANRRCLSVTPYRLFETHILLCRCAMRPDKWGKPLPEGNGVGDAIRLR
jgi:hypothetical protein